MVRRAPRDGGARSSGRRLAPPAQLRGSVASSGGHSCGHRHSGAPACDAAGFPFGRRAAPSAATAAPYLAAAPLASAPSSAHGAAACPASSGPVAQLSPRIHRGHGAASASVSVTGARRRDHQGARSRAHPAAQRSACSQAGSRGASASPVATSGSAPGAGCRVRSGAIADLFASAVSIADGAFAAHGAQPTRALRGW